MNNRATTLGLILGLALGLFADGTDIVLVARPGIVNLSYDELRTALLESFEAVAATRGSRG